MEGVAQDEAQTLAQRNREQSDPHFRIIPPWQALPSASVVHDQKNHPASDGRTSYHHETRAETVQLSPFQLDRLIGADHHVLSQTLQVKAFPARGNRHAHDKPVTALAQQRAADVRPVQLTEVREVDEGLSVQVHAYRLTFRNGAQLGWDVAEAVSEEGRYPCQDDAPSRKPLQRPTC